MDVNRLTGWAAALSAVTVTVLVGCNDTTTPEMEGTLGPVVGAVANPAARVTLNYDTLRLAASGAKATVTARAWNAQGEELQGTRIKWWGNGGERFSFTPELCAAPCQATVTSGVEGNGKLIIHEYGGVARDTTWVEIGGNPGQPTPNSDSPPPPPGSGDPPPTDPPPTDPPPTDPPPTDPPPTDPPPTDPPPTDPPPSPPSNLTRGCPTSGYTRLVNVNTDAGISSALSNAQPGDQIRIAAGRYSGNRSLSRSGTATNPLVICGMPGAAPVLKGGQFKSKASYLVLTGLVFEGAAVRESVNNVYLNNAHHVTFTGNEIRGGHYHAGLSTDEVHHMVITYNYIHDNGHDTSHDHGIYFKTTTGPGNVISNNLLVRNAARGLSLHDNSGAGVYDVLVTHNTIVGNGSTGILVNDGDRMTLANNISAYNGDKTGQRQIRVSAGNNNRAYNNLTFHPTSSRAGIENSTGSQLAGNLVADPQLTADYHLTPGSPAINLGRQEFAAGLDYDSNPRGSPPDAGAFEK